MTVVVVVFGFSATPPNSPAWKEAERLGAALARRGWTVSTGGYGGTMEAVSAGASAEGGRVIGVTAPSVFPNRSGANPHVTEEIQAPSLPDRIATLVGMADAVIALPGSLGTFTELMVAWNAAFVAPFHHARPIPVVAVGDAWAEVIGSLSKHLTGLEYVHAVPGVEEALALVTRLMHEERE